MLFVWLNVKLKKIDCDALFIRVPFSSPGGVVLHCPRRTGMPCGGRGPRAAWFLLSLPCAEGGLWELRRLSDPPPHNPIGLRQYFPYWADFLNLESKKSLWLVQSSTTVSSAQFCLQSLCLLSGEVRGVRKWVRPEGQQYRVTLYVLPFVNS